MTRRQLETTRERKLQPRYVMVDGRRVLEPAEATEARRRKWHQFPEAAR